MYHYFLKAVLLLIIPVSLSAQKDTVRVFYLGGQSNMDGHGYTKDLPDTLDKEFSNVWIYHGQSANDDRTNGGLGKWEKLRPGHGNGFKSDGEKNKPSNRFGIEISFAARMQLKYPGEKIALIKYSKGGSSIHVKGTLKHGTWEPDYNQNTGINQYDYYLKTLRDAFENQDIDGDGQNEYWVPTGILWMQGESDANDELVAKSYYGLLKRLMGLIRASLRADDLPIVIGKISDSGNDPDGLVWDYGDLVQHAQEEYVRKDDNAAIVRSTKNYDYSDKWHYDSKGYIDLGIQFAEELIDLIDNQDNK